MIPPSIALSISLLYIGLLFTLALYADRKRASGKSIISNPYIYSLSIAVFFTSWAIYGYVGRAATVGLDFLIGDLAPTLMAFTWCFLLRKMVRISKEQKLTTIADFISSRYGKSVALGALITVFAVFGIMPYIAVQLKAIAHTFNILTSPPENFIVRGEGSPIGPSQYFDTGLIVSLLLGFFAVLFGARHLDTSERHEGLVAVIALEAVVKLVAILCVGLFVTYGLFDGVTDIFARFDAAFPGRGHLLLLGTEQIPYSSWFTVGFICMMAFMFLPRQFHIMVVENSNEEHIYKAMWLYPTYAFLFHLFIVPIALAGLILNGGDVTNADFFSLLLPLQAGHSWLALVVFLGGLSAGAGMVIVSSLATTTMILNHLIMPIVLRLNLVGSDMSGLLINLKRLGIMAVILLSYLYYRFFGESYALVNIGLASFVAVTQFAPAFFGALYWKRANLRGATSGLILGFIVWFYTLMVPLFVSSGWLRRDILEKGPFDLGFLRPLELFGLNGLDMWSHSLFWTLFFNVGTFVALSLLTGQNKTEREQAAKFADVFAPPPQTRESKRISKAPTMVEFVDLMSKFIGGKQAQAAITSYQEDRGLDQRGNLSEYDLPDLKRFTERTLAGSVGAAPARIILENYLSARGSEMEDVFDIFGSVTLSRKAGREQLGILHETSRIVASGADLQIILDKVLGLLTQQFKFDLCVIRILDEEKRVLRVRSQRGMSSEHLGSADRELNMETYVGQTFLTNAVTLTNDTDFLDKPVSAQTIHREGIKSFAHAPITIEGEPVGVLSAFSTTMKGIFTDEFIDLFKNVAGQVGVACRNARQSDKLIEAREREKELQIARTIQLGLLPAVTPDIEGLSLAGTCVPAKEVGGDYYDYLLREDGVLDLVIADVSGHSVGAAFIMTETRTFIQAKAQDLSTSTEIVSSLNEFLYEDLTRTELFITLFYAKYNPRTHQLAYASAGHNPPLLWRAQTGKCERLDAEGLILGVMAKTSFEEKYAQLYPGDMLLLYTDGITEAESPDGAFFGEEQLCALLQEHSSLPPQELLETLLSQARLFTGTKNFNDDISLVLMRSESAHIRPSDNCAPQEPVRPTGPKRKSGRLRPDPGSFARA